MQRWRGMVFVPRALGILVLALALAPRVATACAIDNKASLFTDGVQATLTTAAPTATGLWAPFTVEKAFASGVSLRFSELHSDLARTLPAAALAAPYRWAFGDGATALGHVVAHRYTRPGLYRLMVYGLSAATRSWFPFDRVLLRVVAPGQVLQANLGYYALRALDVIMSSLMWLIDAALILLVLFAVLHRLRSRRGEGSAEMPDESAAP